MPPIHLVCERISTLSVLALRLSLHRHPDLYIPPSARFIRYNKQKHSLDFDVIENMDDVLFLGGLLW
jgi:hypothetical protein